MSGTSFTAAWTAGPHGITRYVTGAAALAWRHATVALEIALSRRHLREMDTRMLQDLGISRAQADFEAARAPWDIHPIVRR